METVWFFQYLLIITVSWNQYLHQSRAKFLHCWGNTLMSILSNVLALWSFTLWWWEIELFLDLCELWGLIIYFSNLGWFPHTCVLINNCEGFSSRLLEVFVQVSLLCYSALSTISTLALLDSQLHFLRPLGSASVYCS